MPGGVQTQKQTFSTHLTELRRRLIAPIIIFFVVTVVAFIFSDQLVHLLQRPLNKTLYYSSPAGGFSLVFQVAMFAGLLVALPLLVRQLTKFIEPIMSRRLKYGLNRYFLASLALALIGVACGYLISLPSALRFLNSFEDANVQALISADQYLSFVMVYLAGFAIVFQLPLIISISNRITPLKPRKLLAKFKYVVVGAFVVAAILTPTPDVVNQAIFAAPILILYICSIGLVALTNAKGRVATPNTISTGQVEDLEAIPLSREPLPDVLATRQVVEQAEFRQPVQARKVMA